MEAMACLEGQSDKHFSSKLSSHLAFELSVKSTI